MNLTVEERLRNLLLEGRISINDARQIVDLDLDTAHWVLGLAERNEVVPGATSRSELRQIAHTRGVCPICSRKMAA